MRGGKQGRQPRNSDAAIQACLTLKVLFGMPLRQAADFVESLLKLVNLDWRPWTSARYVGVRKRYRLPSRIRAQRAR